MPPAHLCAIVHYALRRLAITPCPARPERASNAKQGELLSRTVDALVEQHFKLCPPDQGPALCWPPTCRPPGRRRTATWAASNGSLTAHLGTQDGECGNRWLAAEGRLHPPAELPPTREPRIETLQSWDYLALRHQHVHAPALSTPMPNATVAAITQRLPARHSCSTRLRVASGRPAWYAAAAAERRHAGGVGGWHVVRKACTATKGSACIPRTQTASSNLKAPLKACHPPAQAKPRFRSAAATRSASSRRCV